MELKDLQKEKLIQLKKELEEKKQMTENSLREMNDMTGNRKDVGWGSAIGMSMANGTFQPMITTYGTLISVIDILLEQ